MPNSGTEIQMRRLAKNIVMPDNIKLILSVCDEKSIDPDRKNVLWEHHNFNQPTVQMLKNIPFYEKLDQIVYVSEWQAEKFTHVMQVPPTYSRVIRNSIDPIEFKPREKGEKLKLIYHTTPWRGLELLLDTFEYMNRDDIELEIYSSTIIYGSEYDEVTGPLFTKLFERAKNMKNVNYHGYVTNEEVIKALQSAHIFVYPSIWQETSCVSMIEAGAAGLSMATTNFGALPETSLGFGNMLQIQSDIYLLTRRFAAMLNETIDNYWSNETQNLLKIQSDRFNYHYGWNQVKPLWEKLFNDVSTKSKYDA